MPIVTISSLLAPNRDCTLSLLLPHFCMRPTPSRVVASIRNSRMVTFAQGSCRAKPRAMCQTVPHAARPPVARKYVKSQYALIDLCNANGCGIRNLRNREAFCISLRHEDCSSPAMTDAALNSSDAVRPLRLQHLIVCPHCGDTAIRRSRTRGMVDRLYRLIINWRPYRCQVCSHRFMARRMK
jgi:predicted RNA-binding Zn-ribbon protein involved in translation (DUF1610 family)